MKNKELSVENIQKAMKSLEKARRKPLLTKRKLRDIQWSMNFRPTPQEISVRRVQTHVDENPLEMVQLSTNEISAVEMLEGYYDNNRYEEVTRSYRGSL